MDPKKDNSTSSGFGAVSNVCADIDLSGQGKEFGYIRVPHSVHRSAYGWIPIPIARIGNGEGPQIVLIAGNHGDEWEGQLALGNLIRELEPEHVHGRLVIVPSANFPAVMAATRTSPIDSVNMNRAYPGNENGTVTEQIAHWIEHVLLDDIDFAMDLHSGGSSLMYLPSALAMRDDDPTWMDRSLDLLRAFGAPVSYLQTVPQGGNHTFLSACRRRGVVGIGTELGGGGTLTGHSLSVAEAGIRRVLAHVGLLRVGFPVPPPQKTRLTEVGGDDYYVYASDSGVFEPIAEPGDEVTEGSLAARIHFPDTPSRAPAELSFKRSGLVLCKRLPSRCERGDCLYHLGTDCAL